MPRARRERARRTRPIVQPRARIRARARAEALADHPRDETVPLRRGGGGTGGGGTGGGGTARTEAAGRVEEAAGPQLRRLGGRSPRNGPLRPPRPCRSGRAGLDRRGDAAAGRRFPHRRASPRGTCEVRRLRRTSPANRRRCTERARKRARRSTSRPRRPFRRVGSRAKAPRRNCRSTWSRFRFRRTSRRGFRHRDSARAEDAASRFLRSRPRGSFLRSSPTTARISSSSGPGVTTIPPLPKVGSSCPSER